MKHDSVKPKSVKPSKRQPSFVSSAHMKRCAPFRFLGKYVWWGISLGVPLLFLTLFFLWPLLAMFAQGFGIHANFFPLANARTDSGIFAPLASVLSSPRTWRIFGQTIFMAGAGTLGSLVLGIPAALLTYTRDFPFVRFLRTLILVPFVLPTVVVASAFRALLGVGGPLEFLGLDSSIAAVVAAMVFFNSSLIVRTVGVAASQLDDGPYHVARTLGDPAFRAWRKIVLPALMPSIAGAASMVFLFCSTAYALVSILGAPGYGSLETEMWVQTTQFLRLDTAAVLSLLQCVIVGIAIGLSALARARAEGKHSRSQQRGLHEEMTIRPPRALRCADIGLVIPTFACVLLIISPLGALVKRAFTFEGHYSLENFRLLASAGEGFAGGISVWQSLVNSLESAIIACICALILGILAASFIAMPVQGRLARMAQNVFDGLVMLPLGVSSVTIGFGFFLTIRLSSIEALAGPLLVPSAQAVIAFPLVVRTLVPIIKNISAGMRESARVLGASPLRLWLTLDFPLLARGIGVASGFALAMALGEFGATSFLASPLRATLPVVISKLLSRPGAHNYGMAMAGAVILGTIALICMLAGELLARKDNHGSFPRMY